MEEMEVRLVKESWAQVVPIAQEAMAMFYSNLFSLDEKVARLFDGKDMLAQGSKLSNALNLVIENLDQPGIMTAKLQEIGARHADYGATEADFETVGKALIMTLESGLGDSWAPAHERAWTVAYTFVSDHMIAGLRTKQAA